ncbi:MAG: glycosyltransferase [Candidatus Zapsychrus exili]|nr:glycosyltransferase [Candidatus Zapsychrus exili]
MKILLIHASAGAGHLKAAEAVYVKLKNYSEHEVVFADALDYSSSFFKNLYKKTYYYLVSKVPLLWQFTFAVLDIPFLQPLILKLRRVYNAFNVRKLHDYLIKENFDYIISSHFMPTEISSSLKAKGKITSKLITVVTDYDVHRIWLGKFVDMYAVASEWTKKKMDILGIDENKVVITGIPTDEKFSKTRDISELKKKLGVEQDAFTVLMATGSFGIGPIEEIIKALYSFQVVVVCGHNKKLFETLTQKQYESVVVNGLVDNMDELMAVSDVMLTKPGGLSISEALVSQLPLIFFNAIPGQETNNIKVLKEYGVGISNCSIKEIAKELESLRSSRDKFATALMKTKELARPSAVRDIINLIK